MTAWQNLETMLLASNPPYPQKRERNVGTISVGTDCNYQPSRRRVSPTYTHSVKKPNHRGMQSIRYDRKMISALGNCPAVMLIGPDILHISCDWNHEPMECAFQLRVCVPVRLLTVTWDFHSSFIQLRGYDGPNIFSWKVCIYKNVEKGSDACSSHINLSSYRMQQKKRRWEFQCF